MAIAYASNLAWVASLTWVIFLVAAWEMVWKGIALWKSGNNRQIAWFVCIFIFNTLGILPLVYLIWFQRRPLTKKVVRKTSKPKGPRKRRR